MNISQKPTVYFNGSYWALRSLPRVNASLLDAAQRMCRYLNGQG